MSEPGPQGLQCCLLDFCAGRTLGFHLRKPLIVRGGCRDSPEAARLGRRGLGLRGSACLPGELHLGPAEQPFPVASFPSPDQAHATRWPAPEPLRSGSPHALLPGQLRWRLGSRGARGHSDRVPVLPQRDPRQGLHTAPCDRAGHRGAQCNRDGGGKASRGHMAWVQSSG